MSNGFVPGASPRQSTEQRDYFNYRPSSVQSPEPHSRPSSPGTDVGSDDELTGAYSRRPRSWASARPLSRAHFPDDPAQLETRISAPPHPLASAERQNTAATEKGTDGGETVTPNQRGLWGGIREFWEDLKADFGPAEVHHESTTNIVGDTGIDLDTLKKLRASHRLSGLVGSSIVLSSQGFGKYHNRAPSTTSLPETVVGTPGIPTPGSHTPGTSTPATPSSKRFQSGIDAQEVSKALQNLKKRIAGGQKTREAKYVQSRAELATRRTLCLLMTYAFMLYGAPSHRIEEYIMQLFKVCDLDGRVNYTVGCTEICFINPPDPKDPMTRQSYMTLVKAQGLDVGALQVAFRIYKDVIHGEISTEEAAKKIVALIDAPPYHRKWALVPVYGLCSAFACVWAYNGYWADMPIAFFLGSIVGYLQIIAALRNPLYANVLETSAALITSFGARAFASIGGSGQKYFCFASVAESSITTILPGYIVLVGALELQSKSLTAGSTRLFYAVMYSLFLGYGIDVGAQLWAVIDTNAPTSVTCPRSVDAHWKILLVPCYLVLQATLIRSRPKQIPVQVLFGSVAYTVNYFVAKYSTSQVACTAAAFVLGILGHLYARSRHAFAFASVVAGIMVLVPSGLSAQGGLIAGISTPLFNNGTTIAQDVYEQNLYQSFSVGAQMIQVAIGLAVGLFVSALFIYPLGRSNNALFSF